MSGQSKQNLRLSLWVTRLRKSAALVGIAVLIAVAPGRAFSQNYAIGVDVSFLAKCEQDGVVFRENGQPKDALAILREHNFNWVRLRIFHDPSSAPDHLPNDLTYTLAIARRAKAAGFHLLLDFHYSDSWADPGKQPTPVAWSELKHKRLVKQVFTYTRDTVAEFERNSVAPDMVQVGNEVTHGMLWPDGRVPDHWDGFADLIKAGISGVKAGSASGKRPRIMVHIDRSGDFNEAVTFYDNLLARHVHFDVIGLSYYPFWHGDLAAMSRNLSQLALRFHRPIIIVESAYRWMPGGGTGKSAEFPESPEGQLAFLRAVDAAVRAVPNGLGQGVFWWEPAAEGGLRSRSFFDDQGNVLPVVTAFEAPFSP